MSDGQLVVVAQVNHGTAPPARADPACSTAPAAEGDVLGGGRASPADGSGAGVGGRRAADDEAGSLPAGACAPLSGSHVQASGENSPAEMAAQVQGSQEDVRLQPCCFITCCRIFRH